MVSTAVSGCQVGLLVFGLRQAWTQGYSIKIIPPICGDGSDVAFVLCKYEFF